MTAKNNITGDTLKTKTDNQESFASGWDLIWGNKNGSTYGLTPLDIDSEILKLREKNVIIEDEIKNEKL